MPAEGMWAESRPSMCISLVVGMMLGLTLMPAVFHVRQRIRHKNTSAARIPPLQLIPDNPDPHGGFAAPAALRAHPTSRNLTFLTLTFRRAYDRPKVEHNCVLLSRAGYAFHIHTDDMHHRYCSVCRCIQFKLSHCKCPDPTAYDCPLCEKLSFLADRMAQMESFVFLDSDLVILNSTFMPALQARAKHFDFLASYGFEDYSNWHFSSAFNSGLMFVRHLPNLDYGNLMRLMRSMNNNNDQNIISAFIHKYYSRWDTLSLRWHCRGLSRREHDISTADCFTFHGRGDEYQDAKAAGNITLLSITP